MDKPYILQMRNWSVVARQISNTLVIDITGQIWNLCVRVLVFWTISLCSHGPLFSQFITNLNFSHFLDSSCHPSNTTLRVCNQHNTSHMELFFSLLAFYIRFTSPSQILQTPFWLDGLSLVISPSLWELVYIGI